MEGVPACLDPKDLVCMGYEMAMARERAGMLSVIPAHLLYSTVSNVCFVDSWPRHSGSEKAVGFFFSLRYVFCSLPLFSQIFIYNLSMSPRHRQLLCLCLCCAVPCSVVGRLIVGC